MHYVLCSFVSTAVRALGSHDRAGAPTITQYDQWGHRVDLLTTSEAWRDLKAFAQKEGIPAIFYERKYGPHSRVYGYAKALMMVGDAHVVSVTSHVLFLDTYCLPGILSPEHDRRCCPCDTTHGNSSYEAGYTSKVDKVTKLLRSMLIPNNTIPSSRNSSGAFTSGQWMTEVSPSSILHSFS